MGSFLFNPHAQVLVHSAELKKAIWQKLRKVTEGREGVWKSRILDDVSYERSLIFSICKGTVLNFFILSALKGPWRSIRSISTFWLFLMEENVSYQELFLEWKNVVSSQSRENTYNDIVPANLNRDSPKTNLKIYLLHFLR